MQTHISKNLKVFIYEQVKQKIWVNLQRDIEIEYIRHKT
jgi:hypothetical protein